MSSNPPKLSIRSFFPWSPSNPEMLRISERPSSGGFIELPGPGLQLQRSNLRIFPSVQGWAGLLLAPGTDKSDRLLDLQSKAATPFALPSEIAAQQALRLRDGQFLLASEGKFLLFNPDSGQTLDLPGEGQLLGAGPGESYWTWDAQVGSLRLINKQGKEIRIENPGRLSRPIVDDLGRACYTSDGSLYCLAEMGAPEKQEGFTLNALEILLGYGDGALVSDAPGGIRIQSLSGRDQNLPLLSAGLAQDGRPFASGWQDQKIRLFFDGREMEFEVPEDIQARRIFYAVAVEAECVWIKGDADLLQLALDGQVKARYPLDAENYSALLAPRMWQLYQISAWKGRVYLSCSGPSGFALLSLDF